MAELTYIQKGSARVNNQYKFVSHDQVSAAVHPMLVKHGIIILPSVHEIKQEGNRTEIKLLIDVVNADNTQDCYRLMAAGYGIDSGDKGPGKAVSYAYKYALLKIFCLETGEDPDHDANATYEPAKCSEFDAVIPIDVNEKDRKKIDAFLAYSHQITGKHVEDLKREAVKRMPEFLDAAKKWSPKKEKGEKNE